MARLHGKTGNVLVASTLVSACESAWDEQVIGSVTATADTADYKVGNASAKFAVADGFGTGIIGSEIVAVDLSGDTQLMFWAKSSVNLNSGDWQILLDDTALCASPIVLADLPAMTAGEWKLVKIAADLSGCGAIISVGLKQIVDKGAMNFWIDEVRGAVVLVGMKSWSLDQIVDTLDTTGFDSAGVKTFVPLNKGFSGSIEGFKDDIPLTIGTILHLELQESATATQQFRMTAIVTGLHAKADIAGVITYGYDFQGTRELMIPTT